MLVFLFFWNCSINKHENIRWRLKLSVFDVAAYILQKCGDMSCMKLQKLCYYAQAWSLVWDDAPLFDEDFEAWASGPVCPELFHRNERRFVVSASDERGNESHLSDNQKDSIDRVLDFYSDKDARWLSQLAVMEDPWRLAWRCVPIGVKSPNIVSKNSMALYYGELEI